ncbi:MAG: hypothetical protein AB1384_06010 [Actinomycetota bacterium]
MCRDGIDLVTLKVALKHSADLLEKEIEHLRQWSALASNVNLGDISSRLREASLQVAGSEELVASCVRSLAELQVQGPSTAGTGVTITPV